MSSTKNVGQVVGLFVGTSAPDNTKLIWFDETPNQQCHKIHDPVTKLWKVLNPEIVSNTTYSELVNNAKKNGLSIGKFYQITDKSNTLAIAITTTKVQYSDNLGNILIDDLGSNIQYHVSSGNLLIDDLNGVFDTENNKLIFTFSETENLNVETDYLFGKTRSGNKWSLSKFKLSLFLSKSSGNSLSWKNGFFFNFLDKVKELMNKEGGLVSYDNYLQEIENLVSNINNVAKENQNIINNASQEISQKTNDSAIFNKKLTEAIDTTVEPGDVLVNDTLLSIVSKFQRWINRLKYAIGIKISQSFADASSLEYINNNDSVESAFGKVQYVLKHLTIAGKLPEDWNIFAPRNDGKPTNETYDAFEQDGYPVPGDTIFYAFAKIVAFIKKPSSYITLSKEWKAEDYTKDVDLPAAGDNLNKAFAKAVAKLQQLGLISNGKLVANSSFQNSDGSSPTVFDIGSGILTFAKSLNRKNEINSDGINIEDADGNIFKLSKTSFSYSSNSLPLYANKVSSSVLFKSSGTTLNTHAAFQAVSDSNAYNAYDAFFRRLKIGIMTYGVYFLTSSSYTITSVGFVIYNSTTAGDIYLPNYPDSGRMVMIAQSASGSINVHASGNSRIDTVNESQASVTINERGAMFVFIFVRGISYSSDPQGTDGLWQYAKWTRTNS